MIRRSEVIAEIKEALRDKETPPNTPIVLERALEVLQGEAALRDILASPDIIAQVMSFMTSEQSPTVRNVKNVLMAVNALMLHKIGRLTQYEATIFEQLVAVKTLSVGPWGVSRMADNDKALLVSFRARPTDDDLRNLHELIRSYAHERH